MYDGIPFFLFDDNGGIPPHNGGRPAGTENMCVFSRTGGAVLLCIYICVCERAYVQVRRKGGRKCGIAAL